ncbi:DUF1549 and DUF1553 domain-containing protein [soil metagenome]
MMSDRSSRNWHTMIQVVLFLSLAAVANTGQAGAVVDGEALFLEQVAPILERRCVHCHGGDRPRGRLSLEHRQGLMEGGLGGPTIAADDPAESLLLWMVEGESPEMPPEGDPLSAEEVAVLQDWVRQGAPWPEGLTLQDRRFAGETWWSLRPLERPVVPDVEQPEHVRNPIDAFILQRLNTEGIAPSPEADRRTYIRRLTFDLHGLPPTPEEIDAFLNDQAPGAHERLVDRLLASPRYGERWARHWLDIARYGDTHGYDKDKRRDHAWPYRDYVIRSLNNSKPYDVFLREQIAGDVLRPDDPEGIIATGFLAAGPWDFVGHVELREGTVEKAKTRHYDRDEMLSGVMSAFVSLTVHCAQCHDHKFDPIPQAEYYALQAVFAGVERGDRSIGPDAQVYAVLPGDPSPIHLLDRGDVEQPGAVVAPGALSCLDDLEAIFSLEDPADSGARRAALADWIADARNPLTWRSIVNRVWQYHFGRGLVDTPSDFGRNGSVPTHPELLDWLAAEFRDGGRSLKDLHRLIVLSVTYRQRSDFDKAGAEIDAENRLLGRQTRRRLSAEEIRDATLFIAGRLDDRMGGPGFALFRFQDDHSPVYDHDDPDWIDPPEGRRRSIYRFVVRSVPNPLLDCLDGADPNASVPVRNETITALQALALLNDPFLIAQAEGFAARLREISDNESNRIEAAFRLALGRSPEPEELEALVGYAGAHGLENACRLIFNLNEFVFVD